MTIYEKLASIQNELIAPKGQRNDFGKYNYRSCEDIIQALKPLCDKNKCVVFITNSLIPVGDRVYVQAEVTLKDLESNDSIVSTAHAREEAEKKGMDGSQITGASSSYARKYALAGLFMIDNEKDSDATNDGKPAKKEATITPEQKVEVLKELNRTRIAKEEILKKCEVKEVDDLTESKFKWLMGVLKKYPTIED